MTQTINSPVYGSLTAPGLVFDSGGAGIALTNPDPWTGLGATTFPALLVGDAGAIFPTYVPEPEKLVYQYISEATQWRLTFPEQYWGGASLPAAFGRAPDIEAQGPGLAGIPVIRGWPAYPGEVPAIGVALGTESEDTGEDAIAGGFAGDATLYDPLGNVLAVTSYYAEPLYTSTVVELIHENRDERDRLHNELRRTLFPLRRILPDREALIRRVQVDAEKSELDESEAPMTIYASIFTVHVWGEMLTPGDVVTQGGVVNGLAVTVTNINPALPTIPADTNPQDSIYGDLT